MDWIELLGYARLGWIGGMDEWTTEFRSERGWGWMDIRCGHVTIPNVMLREYKSFFDEGDAV